MTNSKTLYEQIGGQAAIDRLVDSFYGRVLSDPFLAPFFANSSLEHLTGMQKAFFSVALDGPSIRDDISLAKVHANRGIRREHLSRFTEHLLATLIEAGLDEHATSAIVSRIATYSGQILGESGGVDG